MTNVRRKALYLAFIVGFLLSAPAVVFYTAGYRLNWERREVVETGLISVSTVPRGADVLVDGAHAGERTPAVVGNLAPGEHLLRLEKPGYLPWEKRLVVKSRFTTFAHDVLLYLDEEPVSAMDGVVRAASAPREGTFALALEEGGWVEIWALTPEGGSSRQLERLSSSTAGSLALELSADGSVLRLTQGTGKLARVTMLYASTGQRLAPSETADVDFAQAAPEGVTFEVASGHLRVQDGTGDPYFFETDATAYAWHDRVLAFARGNELYAYDLETREETLVIPTDAPVRHLIWHPDGTTVVAVDDFRAYAVELDPRGGHAVTTLFEGAGLGMPWIDGRGRTLYAVATVDGVAGLFARALQR